jgi:hypothetical protein
LQCIESEVYTEEQLKRKTRVIDENFIDELEQKYARESDEELAKEEEGESDEVLSEEEEKIEIKPRQSDQPRESFLEQEEYEKMDVDEREVAKNGLLPSILDSKLWKVKVKIGMERQLVMQILRKSIDYLNKEKPFMILTVFNCDKNQGTIYVEAHKLAHVKVALEGISGVYQKGIEMIPFKDMT